MLGVLDADRRGDDLYHVAGLVPDEAATRDVGMERPHEYRHAVERQALLHKPPAEVLQHVLGPLGGLCAFVQPLDDRSDV